MDFSGTPVTGELTVDTGIGAIRVLSGEGPQVAVLTVDADPNAKTPLKIRKFTTTTPIDGGTQLGTTETLGASNTVPWLPSVCYVPEADVFIAAWSGDFKSDGVYFQRFR